MTMFQLEKNRLTRRRHALTSARRPDLSQCELAFILVRGSLKSGVDLARILSYLSVLPVLENGLGLSTLKYPYAIGLVLVVHISDLLLRRRH